MNQTQTQNLLRAGLVVLGERDLPEDRLYDAALFLRHSAIVCGADLVHLVGCFLRGYHLSRGKTERLLAEIDRNTRGKTGRWMDRHDRVREFRRQAPLLGGFLEAHQVGKTLSGKGTTGLEDSILHQARLEEATYLDHDIRTRQDRTVATAQRLEEEDQARRLHHREDPDTSAAAAENLVASGRLTHHQEDALRILNRWPGRTVLNLAALQVAFLRDGGFARTPDEVDLYQRNPSAREIEWWRQRIGRRLSELATLGKAHRGPKIPDSTTGEMAYTWRPGPEPPE